MEILLHSSAALREFGIPEESLNSNSSCESPLGYWQSQVESPSQARAPWLLEEERKMADISITLDKMFKKLFDKEGLAKEVRQFILNGYGDKFVVDDPKPREPEVNEYGEVAP